MGGGEDGGDSGGDGGMNLQMHRSDEEHEPVLRPPQTSRRTPVAQTESWQPGGLFELEPPQSNAVLSDRSSAVAAASHSLVVEMRAPPQEPLSIM